MEIRTVNTRLHAAICRVQFVRHNSSSFILRRKMKCNRIIAYMRAYSITYNGPCRGWICANLGLVYFKTSEKKTRSDPDMISAEEILQNL
jgi:hypothetical protein